MPKNKHTEEHEMYSDEEILENKIINKLRSFSEEDQHNWTTGFQRQIAKTIIVLVRREEDKLKNYLERITNLLIEGSIYTDLTMLERLSYEARQYIRENEGDKDGPN